MFLRAAEEEDIAHSTRLERIFRASKNPLISRAA
jgi:hypothetical protein